jgi:hypothetical protein
LKKLMAFLLVASLAHPALSIDTPPKKPLQNPAPNRPVPPQVKRALDAQLLDAKTEQFYRDLIGDELAVFSSIKCVSTSIDIAAAQFAKSKYALNDYKADMEQFYQALLETFLVGGFTEISKNNFKMVVTQKSQGADMAPTIASPFARELQGLVMASIRQAGPLAIKLPGFHVQRKVADTNPAAVFFNALSAEKLNTFISCLSAIRFVDGDLQAFQAEQLKMARLYQSQNKSEALLGH